MTTMKEIVALRKKAALEMYEKEVPDHAKNGDVYDAVLWARTTLMEKEGSGHEFHLSAAKDGGFYCSFAKPEWGGDHCSDVYDEAEQAIIMAVCEYLCGM